MAALPRAAQCVRSGVFRISHSLTSMTSEGGTDSPIAVRQPGGQQLIGQHPDMLRVVAEFDHVQIVVGGQHEMALRSAPHASNLLDRDHCHRRSPLRRRLAASSSILDRPLLVASPRRKHMEQAVTTPNGSRRNEDIALDLLKFVAASAGLAKGTVSRPRALSPPPVLSPKIR